MLQNLYKEAILMTTRLFEESLVTEKVQNSYCKRNRTAGLHQKAAATE